MTSSFDQFEFISDPRDGKNFDLIKNLEAAVLRGSEHARGILNGIKRRLANPNVGVPHSKIVGDLKAFEDRWEVIRAFEEDDEGDEDEIEDQEEISTDILEWFESLDTLHGQIKSFESFRHILDKYINFEGYGSFGQGAGYKFDLDFWHFFTNPFMPRDLLWEFSVGDKAKQVSDPDGDGSWGVYPYRWLDEAPRYVNHLSISPIASTNLLKAINKAYCQNDPFHLHTMLNVNADIWLLKDLNPESVRDNLVYELNLIEDGSAPCFDEDFEEKYAWLLKPYFATSSGLVEYNEAENVEFNKFSNPHGCGAILIATRMSEEFKFGNVEVADHLDSDSEILRTLLYYNPDLAKNQKDSLKKLGIIELDNDVAELYKNAWNPDNPTIVM